MNWAFWSCGRQGILLMFIVAIHTSALAVLPLLQEHWFSPQHHLLYVLCLMEREMRPQSSSLFLFNIVELEYLISCTGGSAK